MTGGGWLEAPFSGRLVLQRAQKVSRKALPPGSMVNLAGKPRIEGPLCRRRT